MGDIYLVILWRDTMYIFDTNVHVKHSEDRWYPPGALYLYTGSNDNKTK